MKIRKLKNYMGASLIGVSLLLAGCESKRADSGVDVTALETTVSKDAYSSDKFEATEIFMLDNENKDEDVQSLETFEYDSSDINDSFRNSSNSEEQEYNSNELIIVGFYNPSLGKEVYSIMKPKYFSSHEQSFKKEDFGNLFNDENVKFFNYEMATCYDYYLQGVVDNSSYSSLTCKFDLFDKGLEAVNSIVAINFDDVSYIQEDKVIKYKIGMNDTIFSESLSDLYLGEEKFTFEKYHHVFLTLNSLFEIDEKISKQEIVVLQDRLNSVTSWEQLLPNKEEVPDISVKYYKR